MIYTKENVYKKALKEVYEFINILSDEERNKIPQIYISNIEKEMDASHQFVYDITKKLSEQNFMNESKAIIVDIYIKYFSEKEECEKWEKYYKISNKLIEERKRKEFNPNNIFTDNNKKIEERENETKNIEEVALTIIDNNIFKDIINRIKSIIKKFFDRGK